MEWGRLPLNAAVQPYVDQILEYYPDLKITAARLLAKGGQFSHIVVVDDALIFRFPRSAHVAAELASEIPLLKALQGKLPLAIPNPTYRAEDSQTGNLVFVGYPMLPGQPLLRDVFAHLDDPHIVQQVAEELGDFLKVLHSLPLALVGAEAKSVNPKAFWEQLYLAFKDKLFGHMRAAACQAVTVTFDKALNDASLWAFAPVLCHGDLGAGNILYAAGHVSSVIDFTFCGPGDPAQDVGALLVSYGPEFIEHVFAVYPELRATLPRVQFITSTYALQQALYALRDGNEADFVDGLRDYV